MDEPDLSSGLGAPGAWGLTWVYGAAHFGKSLFWHASEILFAFYLTELCGLPPQAMGLILAIGLMLSAAIDVAIGGVLKATLSDVLRASRLQIWGAVGSAISLAALFLGTWIPIEARFAFALATGVAFRLTYALCDIPQNALLTLGTSDTRSRTVVATLRLAASGAAAMVIAAAVAPLLAVGAVQVRAGRFLGLGVILSVVAIGTAWALRRGVVAARPLRAVAPPRRVEREQGPPTSWSVEIALFLVLMFVLNASLSTFSKLEPYFVSFVLRSPGRGGVLILAFALAGTLSQPLWMALAARMNRAATVALTAAALVISAAGFWATAQRTDALSLICALGFGASSGGLGMVAWAGFADAVARSARGREGLAYGLFTAVAKIALAIAGLGIGLFLSRIDYRGADRSLILTAMTLCPIIGGGVCLALAAGLQVAGSRPPRARQAPKVQEAR